MTIHEIQARPQLLVDQLVALWEGSVRATHLFLSGDEVTQIKEYVPQALRQVPKLVVLTDNDGEPVAFMGLTQQHLDMLFIAADQRGHGLGKQLLTYGIRHYGINQLTVNEQNPGALGFYQHMGFQVVARRDTDEQGQPYPVLTMRLG
ncbi:acetyltransferase [Levilactobacillus zymae]|uniref:Acetyltransferase n=1 Tax=Levilactobacillus zymae TaxID=267363 RepID=A0ABQ0WZW8_9LACO|nr:GNAT family N-acetyltransferase [Levilactobacillus zymae]KRL13605.1 acetyltransferase [Levilactobacillus zymae DSM 19395]QFR61142.1 GNAT family N-acetyltransferase [Levilactobacillus zymae]GEO71992.1 acetyltransferase [Levilactobacillus zymae]